MDDTIFALSSGLPPAGIAVLRISGPRAGDALVALAGRLPAARHATLARLKDMTTGDVLDHGLIIWFPGPASVTGEDLAELHLHGSRAVVARALSLLGEIDGCRAALAGEFTRRAYENGRIDLSEAEGLADLLAAETEGQRQAALVLAEGALGRAVACWQSSLLGISARIEADIDFSDEADVGATAVIGGLLERLIDSLQSLCVSAPAERLKDGIRVVLAGPPNSGKSSLFNMLIGRDAAIVSDIAGTTRDRIEAPIILEGIPLVLIDTAGLREDRSDTIEEIGIARTCEAIAAADVVLWLGAVEDAPGGAIILAAKADLRDSRTGLRVSALTGQGIDALRRAIVSNASALLPRPGALALNARHRAILGDVLAELLLAHASEDPLIAAEHLRLARLALDMITGQSGVEDMLDALFGTFCIGK